MEAGRRAGVGTLIRLVHAQTPAGEAPPADVHPDVHSVDSLLAAAALLERLTGDATPVSR
jgi:hypothetical protein